MRANEGFVTSFTAAGTKAVVDAQGESLKGGAYQLAGVSALWGTASLQLQRLGPDGSTYTNVGTAFTSNSVQSPLYLPPGQYQWVQTNAGTVTVSVLRIPFD